MRPSPRTLIRSGTPGPSTGTLNSRRMEALGRAASARNSIAVRLWMGRHSPSAPRTSTTTLWSAGSVRRTSKRSCQAPQTGDGVDRRVGLPAHSLIQWRSPANRTASRTTVCSFGPLARRSLVSPQRARAARRPARIVASNWSAWPRRASMSRAHARVSRLDPRYAAAERQDRRCRGAHIDVPFGEVAAESDARAKRPGKPLPRGKAPEEGALGLETGHAPAGDAGVPALVDLPPRIPGERPVVAGEGLPRELAGPSLAVHAAEAPREHPWRVVDPAVQPEAGRRGVDDGRHLHREAVGLPRGDQHPGRLRLARSAATSRGCSRASPRRRAAARGGRSRSSGIPSTRSRGPGAPGRGRTPRSCAARSGEAGRRDSSTSRRR